MALDFSKKVGGVPVVYLGAGAAAILAVVAWRMKPAPSAPTDGPVSATPDAVLDEKGLADGSSPYAGYSTNGTVIVQPSTPPAEPVSTGPDTNDEWIREGAAWLVANKDVSGAAAYTALSKYVEGKSRSVQEAQWVDMVIKEKGLPPDPFTDTPPNTSTPATNPRGYGWVMADGKTGGAAYAARYNIPVSLYSTFNPGVPGIPKRGTWLKVRAASNPLVGYTGK